MSQLVRALGVGLDQNLGIRISKLAQEKKKIPEKLETNFQVSGMVSEYCEMVNGGTICCFHSLIIYF